MGLFDLRFLVSHMLSDDRVKLLDFHLVGHCSLILCSRIVVPGACRGDQLNLISHNRCLFIASSALTRLYASAIVSNIRQYCVYTVLIDDPHTLGR